MFQVEPHAGLPGGASNKSVGLLSDEVSQVSPPNPFKIEMKLEGNLSAASIHLGSHTPFPVRVEGNEIVIDDSSMTLNLAYPVKYHGKEYLVRRRDENFIDIYVVK